jgi:hypothetical protein
MKVLKLIFQNSKRSNKDVPEPLPKSHQNLSLRKDYMNSNSKRSECIYYQKGRMNGKKHVKK